MSTPGYPFMDGMQRIFLPNANEGATVPSPPTIEDMTAQQQTVAAAQQRCRDALRGSMAGPLTVDPDGDND